MQTFPLSELTRKTTKVQHAAARAPVMITEHRAPRFVLMAVEDYDRLVARANDPRAAYRVEDMPAEDRTILLAALDELIETTAE